MWTPTDIQDLIIDRANYYGANASELIRVASCETGGTFSPYLIGSMGERGVAQWLPGNAAWRSTPAYKQYGIDIVSMYRSGDPDAIYFDIDMMAWAFANRMQSQWSCY